MEVQEAIEYQEKMRSAVITHDILPDTIRYIAGVNVTYPKTGEKLIAAMAVWDVEKGNMQEGITIDDKVTFPYIPGLFSFRELPALLKLLERTVLKPDIIVCDGQGLAHPRRFGLASHLGVATGIPTIGCAKNILIGTYQELGVIRGNYSALIHKNEEIGKVLRTQDNLKPLIISIGHKVSLETACFWILQLSTKYRIPEVIRAADHAGRTRLKEILHNA